MSFSTPATRLHDVLSLAVSSRSGSPAIEAWASIFKVGSRSPNFFTRVAELAALAANVKALVEALPDTEGPDLILRHYDEVDSTIANFARVANLNMQQFLEPLQTPGLLSVEMADRALRRSGYQESRLEGSELDELRTEVHDLIADVLGTTGLTTEQQRSIVAHLRAVEDTLMSAMLGDDDLIRANDGLVGSILALPGRVWESDAIRRVAKFAAAVATAVAVNVATQAAENALAPPSPPKPPSVILIERIAHGDDVLAITSSQNNAEVVDAEVVEDDQPSPAR